MTHVQKVPLSQSDLFIYNIDLEKAQIQYDVRDKISGKLLEPKTTSTFTIEGPDDNDMKVWFDKRFIGIPLFNHLLAQRMDNGSPA